MPIMSCTKNNKNGYKWGKNGKCYTYIPNNKKSKKSARKKAARQAAAIYSTGYKK